MATGTHTLLERITVGSAGAASVTFSSIPQTGYTDLKVVTSLRTTRSGTDVDDEVRLEFNGSGGTAYSSRMIEGNGSTTRSATDTSQPYIGRGVAPTDNATASVFSNSEYCIPNYTSSNAKSVSLDTVMENNATSCIAILSAGLWSPATQVAITSMKFTAVGTFDQYSTFSLYGIAASGTTPTIAPKAVGGDIIQTDGTYWYHAFVNTGAFVPATGLTCDVLVVAGGGGGNGGAGGGAGGYVYSTSQSFGSGTSYTTTVGGGGGVGTQGTNSNVTGGTLSLTAAVGGGGANGGNGGSGAGANNGGTPGTATSGQGFAGAAGGVGVGGGGGGAGAVGASGGAGTGGNGGIGLNTWSSWLSATGLGVSGYIAGGGGGTGTVHGTGGTGGGGTGDNTNGGAGTANTGGGGGGASTTPGVGGSGLIIIRYPV